MKTLKARYSDIVGEYIALFEKKHDVRLDYWIGDDVGGTAHIGGHLLKFKDIKVDIDNDIPKGIIFEMTY